jgi:hypothetical protein
MSSEIAQSLALIATHEGSQYAISYKEVLKAQKAWCDGVVKISQLHQNGENYRAQAEQFLAEAYDFAHGKVFFKPTLAYGAQTFRNDVQAALSYFVGGNDSYPTDTGFALKSWVKARFENAGGDEAGIQIFGSLAITMGNVWFTNTDGNDTMVDKTFIFRKGADGKLRLVLHHSSLPFSP